MKALIAKAIHEVNRAYCAANGDYNQVAWDDTSDGIKASALDAVAYHLTNDSTPEESHANWSAFKLSEGWKYGPVKDEALKEHPCLVPYVELPLEQQIKDYLCKAVVKALQPTENKVPAERIAEMVKSLVYKFERVGETTVTGCWAFLPSGFQVAYGESACVDPANYKREDGEKYAKERCVAAAHNKLWELEGYVLSKALS